jgi:hypothetical protein
MPISERQLLRPKGCAPDDSPPPLHPSGVHFHPMMPLSLLGAVIAIGGRTNVDGRPTTHNITRSFWRAAPSHQPAARPNQHARAGRREYRAGQEGAGESAMGLPEEREAVVGDGWVSEGGW